MITDPEEILAEVERMRESVAAIAVLMDYVEEQEAIPLPPGKGDTLGVARVNAIREARREIIERREGMSEAATSLFALYRISIFSRRPLDSEPTRAERLRPRWDILVLGAADVRDYSPTMTAAQLREAVLPHIQNDDVKVASNVIFEAPDGSIVGLKNRNGSISELDKPAPERKPIIMDDVVTQERKNPGGGSVKMSMTLPPFVGGHDDEPSGG